MTIEALATPVFPKEKILMIPEQILLDLFRVPEEGTVIDGRRLQCVKDPIPKDARVTGIGYRHQDARLVIRISSEEFPETMPGEVLASFSPTYCYTKEEEE